MTLMLRKEMLQYLEHEYWTSARDNDLVEGFIYDFFEQYEKKLILKDMKDKSFLKSETKNN